MIRRSTPASYRRMLFSNMSVNTSAVIPDRFSREFWFHPCRKKSRHRRQHSSAWSSHSCQVKKSSLRSLQNSSHLQLQPLELSSSVVQSLRSFARSLHFAQSHSLDPSLRCDKKLRILSTRLAQKLHLKESSERLISSNLPLISTRNFRMLEV